LHHEATAEPVAPIRARRGFALSLRTLWILAPLAGVALALALDGMNVPSSIPAWRAQRAIRVGMSAREVARLVDWADHVECTARLDRGARVYVAGDCPCGRHGMEWGIDSAPFHSEEPFASVDDLLDWLEADPAGRGRIDEMVFHFRRMRGIATTHVLFDGEGKVTRVDDRIVGERRYY
jgi:hypothetical protein